MPPDPPQPFNGPARRAIKGGNFADIGSYYKITAAKQREQCVAPEN